jgi:hypothetical protein
MKIVVQLAMLAFAILIHVEAPAQAQGVYSMESYEKAFRHLGTKLEMLDPHQFFQRADFRPNDIMTIEFKGKTAPSLGIVIFETQNQAQIDSTQNFSPRFYTIYRIVPSNEGACSMCRTEWSWTYQWRYLVDRKWIGRVFYYSELFFATPYGKFLPEWGSVVISVHYRHDRWGAPVQRGTYFDEERRCQPFAFSVNETATCEKH